MGCLLFVYSYVPLALCRYRMCLLARERRERDTLRSVQSRIGISIGNYMLLKWLNCTRLRLVKLPRHLLVKLYPNYTKKHVITYLLIIHRLQLSETKISGKQHPPINADHTHRLITMNIIIQESSKWEGLGFLFSGGGVHSESAISSGQELVQQCNNQRSQRQEELNVIIVIYWSSPQPTK